MVTAYCLELGKDPARVLVVISVHEDTVPLCHPHRAVAFQEPDHEEKAQEAFCSQHGISTRRMGT